MDGQSGSVQSNDSMLANRSKQDQCCMDYKAVHNGTSLPPSNLPLKVIKSQIQPLSHASSCTPSTSVELKQVVPVVKVAQLHDTIWHLPSNTPQGKEGNSGSFSIWGGGAVASDLSLLAFRIRLGLLKSFWTLPLMAWLDKLCSGSWMGLRILWIPFDWGCSD